MVCWMWRLRVGYVDWRTGPSWAQTMHTWKPYTSADISAATSPMTPTRKLNFVCKPRRQPRLKVASLNDTLSGSLCDYRRPLVHFPTAVRPQDVTPANIRPQGVTHSNCQRDICLRSVGLTGYSKHLIRVAVRNPKPHIASHMSLDGPPRRREKRRNPAANLGSFSAALSDTALGPHIVARQESILGMQIFTHRASRFHK